MPHPQNRFGPPTHPGRYSTVAPFLTFPLMRGKGQGSLGRMTSSSSAVPLAGSMMDSNKVTCRLFEQYHQASEGSMMVATSC